MTGALVRNAFRPGYLPELLRKARTRLNYGSSESAAATEWASTSSVTVDAWASGIDAELWCEAKQWSESFTQRCRSVLVPLEETGVVIGGGGAYDLLYFLVRLRRPGVVLETGVAAGWSSAAILEALEVNGCGRLLSSDFPYFRMDDPERYIGLLVPDSLRYRWDLRVRGDRANLPDLLEGVDAVDLVHYDSDKSRPGREWFSSAVGPYLTDATVLVWDDIVDNLHFRDRSAGAPGRIPLSTRKGYVGIEYPVGAPL